MPFNIVRNDITKMKVDAIVNAANSGLKMGGGVCGAIFAAAGEDNLREECDRIGGCAVGEAVITGAGSLPARYVIHTVGPIWQGGGHQEKELLRNAYISALNLAGKYNCETVAFPLISSGIYGYPKDQAMRVAISAIKDFLLEQEMTVYLVVFDKDAFSLSKSLTSSIECFIEEHYVEECLKKDKRRRIEYQQVSEAAESMAPPKAKRSLEDLVERMEESFSDSLFHLIDEKGMTDIQTYKKANIDRKLFSKIRSDSAYKPGRATAIAFAVALCLNLDETLDFIGKAGYTLSNSSKSDLIIRYFIEQEKFDIFEINEALFAFGEPVLVR